jgi:hypothetical protein
MSTKYKKCKHCGSEFVSWNWIYGPFWKTWYMNAIQYPRFILKFWRFFDRWTGECWNCGQLNYTFFKVKKGIPKNVLNETFVFLPRHQLRGIYEDLQWIITQSKHYSLKEKHKLEYRLDIVIEEIKEMVEEQWKLDEKERPINDNADEEKYKNSMHATSIIKMI